MIDDILTVMWKERKGLLRYQGSRRTIILNLVVLVPTLGIIMPLVAGREWADSFQVLIAAVVLPVLLVGLHIPDSFAGERERHTLETLLASRLPDQAILFGKMAVAVGYGWGMTLLVLLLALVTANVAHWNSQVLLYSPTVALGAATLSLLMALLVAGAGVLISMRAATVQRAAQTLLFGILMVPMIGVQGIILLAINAGPGSQAVLGPVLEALVSIGFILVAGAVLTAIDVGLLAAAVLRFRRSRLILD